MATALGPGSPALAVDFPPAPGIDVFPSTAELCVVVDGLAYHVPLAVDFTTAVAHSSPIGEGSPPDDPAGTAVPTAGCPACDPTVSDSDMTCWPAPPPPWETRAGVPEVHTEMIDVALCGGPCGGACGACGVVPGACTEMCYLAGQPAWDALDSVGQAARYLNSYGEVEPLAVPPAMNFPAGSFFDVKGVVTITPAPAGTSGVFILSDPTNSILMVNRALAGFPPTSGEYAIEAGTKMPGGAGGLCSICNIPIADATAGGAPPWPAVGVICCPASHVPGFPPPPSCGNTGYRIVPDIATGDPAVYPINIPFCNNYTDLRSVFDDISASAGCTAAHVTSFNPDQSTVSWTGPFSGNRALTRGESVWVGTVGSCNGWVIVGADSSGSGGSLVAQGYTFLTVDPDVYQFSLPALTTALDLKDVFGDIPSAASVTHFHPDQSACSWTGPFSCNEPHVTGGDRYTTWDFTVGLRYSVNTAPTKWLPSHY